MDTWPSLLFLFQRIHHKLQNYSLLILNLNLHFILIEDIALPLLWMFHSSNLTATHQSSPTMQIFTRVSSYRVHGLNIYCSTIKKYVDICKIHGIIYRVMHQLLKHCHFHSSYSKIIKNQNLTSKYVFSHLPKIKKILA